MLVVPYFVFRSVQALFSCYKTASDSVKGRSSIQFLP